MGFDRVVVEGGGMDAPKKLHENEGGRFQELDGERVLGLPAGCRAVWKGELGAFPVAEGVEPGAWVGRVSVDVLAGEQGRIRIRLVNGESERELGQGMGVWNASGEHLRRVDLWVKGKDFLELEGQPFWIEVENSGEGDLVVDDVAFERFHPAPTRKLLGKANGKLGPDLLVSGAAGFAGLTEHGCCAFSVLEVHPGGPADKAGLEVGDVVLELEDAPLKSSSIKPGWDWFESSHEAALGRCVLAAVDAERKTIRLRVKRDWHEKTIEIRHAHGGQDPGWCARGPFEPALQKDVLAWIFGAPKTERELARDGCGQPGDGRLGPVGDAG